jgi:glucose-1-phosphate thymidylyltransferase
MKALVLAGGKGSRLRPFTYSMPKQLLPIANKPVLWHVLENIRDAGICEVGVIVGDRAEEIRAALGDGSQFSLEITYIEQDAPHGLAHCVMIAEDFLGQDDFVMYLGDNILVGGIARMADEFRASHCDARVVVTKVPDPSEFGVADVDASLRVRKLVEKPAEPISDLALIGVYFFTPAIHRAVRGIAPSWRGELEITDAIQWLVTEGYEVRAEVFDGYWKDTGRIDDVLECNRVLLETITDSIRGAVDAHSSVLGPVIIEPGACIIRSRVVGPAMIAAGTVVVDSYVGPYTTLGARCQLHDAGLEYSIVLNDVSVRDVRGIHGSLIGRSADVRLASGEAARHRLVIGDHTQVELVV